MFKTKILGLPLLSFFLLMGLFSCTKPACIPEEKGFLVDMSEVSGCDWHIIIPNQKLRLLPNNIRDFNINLENYQKVRVSYHFNGGGSACMMGQSAVIDCIVEIPSPPANTQK